MKVIAGRLRGFGLSLAAYSEPARLGSEVLVCVDDCHPSRVGGRETLPPYNPLAFFIYHALVLI
jgi:hypothetical protein